MPTLHLDCFAGISGDMFLGCLLDLGLDPALLERELSRLDLDGYRLQVSRVAKGGITATHLDVHLEEHDHHHDHRHLREIEGLIERSELAPPVKELALRFFRRLGAAEAKVHGVPPAEVHFHEVGAVDSIVDLVGAAIGVWALGITKVTCSPIHVGSGTVRCQHGVLPVPAPATAELLQGVPIYSSGVVGELTTPTGAAIVSTLCQSFGPLPPLAVSRIGYGAGTRDFPDLPNVVRGFLADDAPASLGQPGVAVAMEANIDDMNPEFFDYLTQRLLKAGALDVCLIPVQMKKQRPGTLVQILAAPEQTGALAEILFRESTTIGLRMYDVRRLVLERQLITVETTYGPVRVKVAGSGGSVLNAAPEYEDCRRLAEETRAPLKAIYQAAQAQAMLQVR